MSLKDEKGQSLVELALIIPFMIILFIIFIDIINIFKTSARIEDYTAEVLKMAIFEIETYDKLDENMKKIEDEAGKIAKHYNLDENITVNIIVGDIKDRKFKSQDYGDNEKDKKTIENKHSYRSVGVTVKANVNKTKMLNIGKDIIEKSYWGVAYAGREE